MLLPPGRLRPALTLLTAAAAAAALAVPARSADPLPLRPGASGPNVAKLKYLLRDPRPAQNVFRQVKGTYKRSSGMGGWWNPALGAAVFAYKYRLGYPAAYNSKSHPVAGPFFFGLLRGTAHRPARWISLAAGRLRALEVAQPTVWAGKAIAYEKHLLTLGIHEIPSSSNRGPAISYPALGVPALESATGQYGAAWCVSAQQTVFRTIGYGTFAGDTAGVYAAVDYYAARNEVFAKPKVGSLVAFIVYNSRGQRVTGTGHMGFVLAVDEQHLRFTYAAGNDGNAFREHTIAFGSRPYAFIRLPGVA